MCPRRVCLLRPLASARSQPAAVVLAAAAIYGCAARIDPRVDAGGPACRPGPVANFLATVAQHCWYASPNGRWRTIFHELHYDTLVIHTEATSLEDAAEIATRIVAVHNERFEEIMLYVRRESAERAPATRRVQWVRDHGYTTLDF